MKEKSPPRLSFQDGLILYALAVVAFVPWAVLMAVEDGAGADAGRVVAYAAMGGIVPAAVGMGALWCGKGWPVAACLIGALAVLAFLGHG
jgi:hypothetical protein